MLLISRLGTNLWTRPAGREVTGVAKPPGGGIGCWTVVTTGPPPVSRAAASGGTGLADAALPSSLAVPRLRASSRVFVVSLLIPSTRRLLRPGLYMMCFCIDELSRAGLFLLTAFVTPNVCGFPVNTRLPNSLAVTGLPFRSVRFSYRPRGVPRTLRLSPAGLSPLLMPAASEVMG